MTAKIIPAVWLKHFAYCEYRFYLEHCRGADPLPETVNAEDRAVRQSLDEAYKAAASLEMDIAEAMAKAEDEAVTVSARDVCLTGFGVSGNADEIVFMPDKILVIDEDPGKVGQAGSRLQSWAYCLAFEEEWKPCLPVFAGIRAADTGFEVWAEPLSPKHREEVGSALSRIRQLLDGEARAVRTMDRLRCRACAMLVSCNFDGSEGALP